jgi:hypothetical protein
MPGCGEAPAMRMHKRFFSCGKSSPVRRSTSPSPAAHHPDVAGEPTNTRSEAPRWMGGIELTGEDNNGQMWGATIYGPNTADPVCEGRRRARAQVGPRRLRRSRAHRPNG